VAKRSVFAHFKSLEMSTVSLLHTSETNERSTLSRPMNTLFIPEIWCMFIENVPENGSVLFVAYIGMENKYKSPWETEALFRSMFLRKNLLQ
jgi:hypothetical protein